MAYFPTPAGPLIQSIDDGELPIPICDVSDIFVPEWQGSSDDRSSLENQMLLLHFISRNEAAHKIGRICS